MEKDWIYNNICNKPGGYSCLLKTQSIENNNPFQGYKKGRKIYKDYACSLPNVSKWRKQ